MKRADITWYGRLSTATVLLLLAGGPASAQAPQAAPAVTAVVDVAVIPMDRERVLPHQTVVVRGDRIVALGPAATVRIPPGATRIDGRGKYLLPGLADMHVHLGFTAGNRSYDTLRLVTLLAQGVTTVRDMHSGGSGSVALELKRALASGTRLGPRLYTAGDPAAITDDVVHLPFAALADSIKALKRAGHDFLKLYAWPHPVYDSVMAAARRVGLPVVGHVPSETGKPGVDVPLEQVLHDRWASIEHLTGYFAPLTGVSDLDAYYGSEASHDTMAWAQPAYRWDMAKLRKLAVATRRAGVWNCPTVAMRVSVGAWSPPDASPTTLRWHQRLVEFSLAMVKALEDAGAGLLLGTDGFGDGVADELRVLVTKAGLTPYQALAMGTRNVATFLGTLDSTGTVAVGKRADLVLLDGNPLQDIRATAAPAGVMVAGRWLSRAELARLDHSTPRDP